MSYYLFVFLILAICCLLEVLPLNRRSVSIIRIISFSLVFFTSAFKYETGVDWLVYEQVFIRQPDLMALIKFGPTIAFENLDFELGYLVLSSVIKSLGGTIQLLYFLLAFINIVLLYKAFIYLSPQPILCLIAYFSFVFFILDMSGIRQSVALCLFLYSIRYIIERKIGHYLICILLGSLFHKSIIIFVLLYLYNYVKSYKISFALYVISVFVILFQIRWIQSVILLLLPFLNISFTTEKLLNYFITEKFVDMLSFNLKSMIVLILIVFGLLTNKVIENNKKLTIAFYFLILYAIITNLFFEFSEISTRISSYLIVFTIVFLSYYLNIMHNLRNRLIYVLCIIFVCFKWCSVYMIPNQATISYNPYQNYLLYKILDKKSSGEERLLEHKFNHSTQQ